MNPGKIAMLILAPLLANGQPFEVTYSFSDVNTSSGIIDPTPSPQAQGVIFGSFSALGLSANPSASGRFSFSGWPVGATDGENDASLFTGALSPFSYYEFSMGLQPGYILDLQELGFSMRRSSTGPRNYSVRSNLDAYNDNLPASVGTSTRLGVLPANVFFWKDDNVSASSEQQGSLILPGTGHAAISGTVHFRIYAWNAEASGGTFSIDNFRVKGELIDTAVHISEHPAENLCAKNVGGLEMMVPCDAQNLQLFDLSGKMVGEGFEKFYDHRNALGPGVYLIECKTRDSYWRRKLYKLE